MKRIELRHIYAKAKYRPRGYVEEMLAAGRVDGDWIEFEDGVFDGLKAKYQEPEMPSLDVMARRFFRSIGWWIAKGVPVTRKGEFLERLRVCESNVCGQWLGDRRVARCAACGCSTGVKLWVATETCPKGLWGAVEGLTIKGAFKEVARQVPRG